MDGSEGVSAHITGQGSLATSNQLEIGELASFSSPFGELVEVLGRVVMENGVSASITISIYPYEQDGEASES